MYNLTEFTSLLIIKLSKPQMQYFCLTEKLVYQEIQKTDSYFKSAHLFFFNCVFQD